jgi:hypothetical protein
MGDAEKQLEMPELARITQGWLDVIARRRGY